MIIKQLEVKVYNFMSIRDTMIIFLGFIKDRGFREYVEFELINGGFGHTDLYRMDDDSRIAYIKTSIRYMMFMNKTLSTIYDYTKINNDIDTVVRRYRITKFEKRLEELKWIRNIN